MVSTERRCENCEWWEFRAALQISSNSSVAECTGAPPGTIDNQGIGEWPKTRNWRSCGAFKPRDLTETSTPEEIIEGVLCEAGLDRSASTISENIYQALRGAGYLGEKE